MGGSVTSETSLNLGDVKYNLWLVVEAEVDGGKVFMDVPTIEHDGPIDEPVCVARGLSYPALLEEVKAVDTAGEGMSVQDDEDGIKGYLFEQLSGNWDCHGWRDD
jgi:hypothetical protein